MIEYFIADVPSAGNSERLMTAVRRQLEREIAYIQIRHKTGSAREQYALVEAVLRMRAAIQARHSTRVLVNSRFDIAYAVGADGVHLPAAAPVEGLPGLLVFRSCHSPSEIRDIQADAVTFGPVFASPGKEHSAGLAQLRAACAEGKRVFALGGIDRSNAEACIRAGSFGIAAIRLFLPPLTGETLET